eukprot:6477151-Amphidinium_carterae.1
MEYITAVCHNRSWEPHLAVSELAPLPTSLSSLFWKLQDLNTICHCHVCGCSFTCTPVDFTPALIS